MILDAVLPPLGPPLALRADARVDDQDDDEDHQEHPSSQSEEDLARASAPVQDHAPEGALAAWRVWSNKPGARAAPERYVLALAEAVEDLGLESVILLLRFVRQHPYMRGTDLGRSWFVDPGKRCSWLARAEAYEWGWQLAAEHHRDAFERVFWAWAVAVVDFGTLKGWSDLGKGQMTALIQALANGVDVEDIIRRIPPGGHKEGFGHVLAQAKDAHRRAKRQAELAAARAEEERVLAERAARAASTPAEPKAPPVEVRSTPPAPPSRPKEVPGPSRSDPARHIPRDPPSPPAAIPAGRFTVPGSLFRRPPSPRSEADWEARRAEALRQAQMLEEAMR